MNENNERMDTLLEATLPEIKLVKDLIEQNDIPIQEIIRALVLLVNIKKVCQWGKVSILVKNNRIVSVGQEQQFITDKVI